MNGLRHCQIEDFSVGELVLKRIAEYFEKG